MVGRGRAQVWRPAVRPMRAPRCFGSAAIVIMVSHDAEQGAVHSPLALEGDLGGQREDDVDVSDRQQVDLALGQPVPRRAPWQRGQCQLRHELWATRRWPPSAAERPLSANASIRLSGKGSRSPTSTFTSARLRCPARLAGNAGPATRRMSATRSRRPSPQSGDSPSRATGHGDQGS